MTRIMSSQGCLLFVLLCGCKPDSPHYEELGGMEYTWIGERDNGVVYIRDIRNSDLNQVLNFAFCLAVLNDMNGLRIEDRFYHNGYGNDKPKDTRTLFTIVLNDKSSQQNDALVIIEKEIGIVKYRDSNGEMAILADAKIPRNFDCQ